jgi:hypothetical protein
MTLTGVADQLGIRDWVVRDIEKQMLHRKFARPKLKNLKRIAIDERCSGKGRFAPDLSCFSKCRASNFSKHSDFCVICLAAHLDCNYISAKCFDISKTIFG